MSPAAGRGQGGLTGSVQWALLLPVILLTVLGTIQVGLWIHGRTVATHAAVAGAEVGALMGATSEDAHGVAARVAEGGGLTDVSVIVDLGVRDARVTVSGRMPTFVDLGQTRVEFQATRPREVVS